MIAHITAIRAVSALYVKKRMQWFFWLGAAVLLLLFAFTFYLIQNVSAWWWLLAIPVFSFAVFFVILWGLARALITKLMPPLSRDQQEAVSHFVARLDEVLEQVQTPRFLILLYLIRDAFIGNQHGFLQQTVNHSKALKSEFERLTALFTPLEK